MTLWHGIVNIVKAALNPKSLIKLVAKKILLRPTIAALKSMGITNKDLWTELKGMGFEKAGRSIAVDTAAYIQTLDNVDKVTALSQSLRMPTDLMVETYLPSSRRYRYIANATVQYKGKIGTTQKYISFYTDEWKPLNEYMNDIVAILDAEEYDVSYSIHKLDYEAVLHQKGDSYE